MFDAATLSAQPSAAISRGDIASLPQALALTAEQLAGREVPESLVAAERLIMVASGSALHAAETARPWIELLAWLPCEVVAASEFIGRVAPMNRGTAAILIAGSEETADTIAALHMFKARRVPSVAVIGTDHVELAGRADLVWPYAGGLENGATSARNFPCQVLAMLQFGLTLGLARGSVDAMAKDAFARELQGVVDVCAGAEAMEPALANIAARIAAASEVIVTGRGAGAGLAAEGALKLKSLATLRAEACPAGELRHGLMATIKPGTPLLVCAGADPHAMFTLADVTAARARGAYVIVLADAATAADYAGSADAIVELPGHGVSNLLAQAAALQLIAAHAGTALATPASRTRSRRVSA